MARYLFLSLLASLFFINICFSYKIIEQYDLLGKNITSQTNIKTTYLLKDNNLYSYKLYFNHSTGLSDWFYVYVDNDYLGNIQAKSVNISGDIYYMLNILWINKAIADFLNTSNNTIVVSTRDGKTLRLCSDISCLNGYDYKTIFFNKTKEDILDLVWLNYENMSIFSLNDDNLLKTYLFFYNLSNSPTVYLFESFYIKYPYPINEIDELPYHKLICNLDCVTTQQFINSTFYVNIGSADGYEDKFMPLSVEIKTYTPYEWINSTFYYYLDLNPPYLISYSTSLPNGSYFIYLDEWEINLTTKDLNPYSYACSYIVRDVVGGRQFINYLYQDECDNITIKNINLTDYNVIITLYDYANNSKSYLFSFYRKPNILDCYWNDSYERWCYYKSYPLNQMYLYFDRYENLSIEDMIVVKLSMSVPIDGINTIVFNNLEENISYVSGCDNFTYFYANKTLLCSNNVSYIEMYALPNVTLNPFYYFVENIYQDREKSSEMYGDTYIVANISIWNIDYIYTLVHQIFRNVSYDFKSFLKNIINGYEAYKNYKGSFDIDFEKNVLVKLQARNRIYAIYENDYYLKEKDISIQNPLNVYLKYRVYNKDNITFENIKTNFPMKPHNIFNTTICKLGYPLYIDLSPLQEIRKEVMFKCNIFNYTTEFRKTKLKEGYKYSYIIRFYSPYVPLLNNKKLFYVVNTLDLEYFNKRRAMVVYLNNLGNELNYTIDGELLYIYLPYISGNNEIFVEYWYIIEKKESDSNKEKKDEEKRVDKEEKNSEKKKDKRNEKDKETRKERRDNNYEEDVLVEDKERSINVSLENNNTDIVRLSQEKTGKDGFITGKLIAERIKNLNVWIIVVLTVILISLIFGKILRKRQRSNLNRIKFLESLKKEVL